jgi:microcystin-dependent protein
MPGVKISDLPLATLQGPDIFPVARGGLTLGVKASDILNRITKIETDLSTLSSGTITVIDSPTIDLTYNSTTRQLSADLQPTLNLRDRTVYLPLTAEIPPGTVMSFLGRSAPPGWLVCDGAIVPNGVGPVQGVITNYSRLYAVLGTTYGATPGTLPDLRGYFIRGYGSSTDPSVGANADGTESGAFGQKVADTFQGHKHGLYDPTHGHTGSADPAGKHRHTYQFWNDNQGGVEFGETIDDGEIETKNTSEEPDHTHTVSVVAGPTNVKVLSPTGDQATPGSGDSDGPGGLTPRVGFETKPKNVALLWCVKY